MTLIKKEFNSLIIYGVVLLVMFILSYILPRDINIIMSFILSLSFLYYGRNIICGLKNKSIETLFCISIIFNFIYSIIILFSNNSNQYYFINYCILIYFYKLGKYILNKNYLKIYKSLGNRNILPIKTNSYENKVRKVINSKDIKINDLLICRDNETIPVDGKIIHGNCHVLECSINGNSSIISKKIGDNVLAGSIILDGEIEYYALCNYNSSLIFKEIYAGNSRVVDNYWLFRLCTIFYFINIIVSLILFIVLLFKNNFSYSLINLFKMLSLSLPLIIGFITYYVYYFSRKVCFKKNIFIKNNCYHNILNVSTYAFSKTGVLTYGNPCIYKFYNYTKRDDNELINIASNIVNNYKLPYSMAFNISSKLECNGLQIIDNLGIKGNINNNKYYLGNINLLKKLEILDKHLDDYHYLEDLNCNILYLLENQKVIGLFGIKDKIREECSEVIDKLRDNKMIMLSSDRDNICNDISKELDLFYLSELSSDDKLEYMIDHSDSKIMMIGNGINDLKAFNKAYVSVLCSNNMLFDNVDILLMDGNLNNVLFLKKISNKVIKIIYENIIISYILSLVLILFEFSSCFELGLLFINVIFVLINTLRLKVFH